MELSKAPKRVPRLAKSFGIASDGSLLIDGEPFPWYVSSDITVTNEGGIVRLSLDLFIDPNQ